MFETINIVIGTSWTATGLICVALSVPLIAGRVGRNAFYGVRFPEAFRSDEAWFAINRFGGKRLALWSIPQIVCGIAAYFVPIGNSPLRAILFGFGPLMFVLIPTFETWRYARRLDLATQP